MRIASSKVGRSCLMVLGIAALSGGCNPEPYPKRDVGRVTGTITYNGAPVEMGQVIFQPPAGAFTMGEIQPDGTYSLEAVIGPNQVQIISRDPPDESLPEDRDGKPPEPPKSYIPEKYSTPQSGLTFEVEAGDNTADFELKDQPSAPKPPGPPQ